MRWPSNFWGRRERVGPYPETEPGSTASARAVEPAEIVEMTDGVVPAHVLVFMHVPKCGGTSIHDWLTEVVAPGTLSRERNRLPVGVSRERLAELQSCRVFSGHFDVVDVEKFPSPQRRFTVFRDPVDRIVSLYDYWRAHTEDHVERHDLAGPRAARAMSFDEFVRSEEPVVVRDIDNTYVRTFTGLIRSDGPISDRAGALAAAIDFVDSLDHVGYLDRVSETFTWLHAELGVERVPTVGRRNVRGQWDEAHLVNVERTVPTPDAVRALEPLVELDRVLMAKRRR